MMSNALRKQFLENLPFTPTESQKKAIDELILYLTDTNPYALFLLKGYAGTGKTLLVSAIAHTLIGCKTNVMLMASTGRAAKVLAEAVGLPAYTIHRTIYQSTAATPEQGGSFSISKAHREPTVFIVDEASMIGADSNELGFFGSGNLLSDLLAYVWANDGCRLILVGDTAQLPPIGCELSPALDRTILEQQYGMHVYESELDDVVRQESTSGILLNATMLRQQLNDVRHQAEGTDNNEITDLKIRTHKLTDVQNITGTELIDMIAGQYRKYGKDECMVVAYSNKRALAYNLGIRNQVLNYDEMLVRGERLVVARNNYAYAQRRDRSDFIANGEIIRIIRLRKQYELYGLHFADATIIIEDRNEEVDVRLILDGLTAEAPQLTYAQRTAFYQAIEEDYAHISSVTERRKAIRKDPFWSALEVKYAYAMTCHKAQGGQWASIFVDMGMLSIVPKDQSLLRWLYTAITRATDELILVNPPEDMCYHKGEED